MTFVLIFSKKKKICRLILHEIMLLSNRLQVLSVVYKFSFAGA